MVLCAQSPLAVSFSTGQGLNLFLHVSLLWFHVWPSQPPFPFGPSHLLLSPSPRALEAILSLSIDCSPLIQYILIIEFSIQKVSPISLVFKFWEPLNISNSIAINKTSFSFQGSELERGASEYIPGSTWFSARHHTPTIFSPTNGVSVAPLPRGMAGKNHVEP